MTVKLIVNADDFGLSPGVNRGIVTAFREGLVTSTTMMTGAAHFEDALGLARENPDLPIGVHLTLVGGAAVSRPEEAPTLVRPDGALPASPGVLLRSLLLGRLSIDDVKTEMRNQIGKLIDAGIRPTHLDTHKHTHCLPRVFEALVQVAGEFEIRCCRLPVEERIVSPGGRPPRLPWRAVARRRIIRHLCRRGRATLERVSMKTTDHFVGIEYTDCLDFEALDWILRGLRPGVTELMCHPGRVDDELRQVSRATIDRERELAGLRDKRLAERLATHHIQTIHYGNL